MFKSTRELFKQEETSFSSISWKQQLSTYLEKLPYSQVSCTWWTSDMESHGLLLVGLKIITSILLWRNEAFPFYLCCWCSLQANPCTGLKQNSSVHNTHCRGWQLVQTSNRMKSVPKTYQSFHRVRKSWHTCTMSSPCSASICLGLRCLSLFPCPSFP